MSKTLSKIICVVLASAALALGSAAAVSAAGRGGEGAPVQPSGRQWALEEITARILQMENRDRVEAVLVRLVENMVISQGDANQILEAWDEDNPDWKTPMERLTSRLMGLHNRDRVEAVLDRLVGEGIISQGEANQILSQWDEEYPDWQSPLERITARVMEMQNRDRVEAVLDRAVEAGLISQGEANQILKQWDDHPHPQAPSAPPARTRTV